MKALNYRIGIWLMTFSLFLSTSTTFVSCTFEDNAIDPKPEEPTSQGFFTDEINKLIDENYEKVKANGYAKLVIPKSLYKEGLFTFPVNAASDMKCMVDAGYKAYVNGGTVRDGVMGTPSHDIDFSTNASIDQIVATVPNAKSFNAFKNIWVVKAYHDGDIETDFPLLR